MKKEIVSIKEVPYVHGKHKFLVNGGDVVCYICPFQEVLNGVYERSKNGSRYVDISKTRFGLEVLIACSNHMSKEVNK